LLEKIDVWFTHDTSHIMSVDYERLSYLLAQSKQLEAYGETDLVHAVWKRIIELLTSALDEHAESTIDFIPDIPTPPPSETSSEPDDRLEGMTRKDLLVIWNDLRGKPHTIKSVHAKPILISEIRRLRAGLARP
jgi:hypothetical protein